MDREWQPISTAPKSETVLLWTEHGELALGHSDDPKWGGAWTDDKGPNFDATHWMYPPDPPNV